MLGQLFPRHGCAKRKMSTNNNFSFKSSKLKRKIWWDRRRRRRRYQENEKEGVRAQTIRDPNLRYFDLWREKTPGCSEIHLQEHPLGVIAIEESAKVSLSLFLSSKEDEANITSTLTDDIKHTWSTLSKSALGPPFPRKPFLLPLIVF